jgi:hypothetical protein
MSRILMTAIEELGEAPYTRIWELDKEMMALTLGFGNGVWADMRIIGESEETLTQFRGLLQRGGYTVVQDVSQFATLFRAGDECWESFVFIDPIPQSLDV